MRKVWLCIFYALCIFTIVFSLFWMALPSLPFPAMSISSLRPMPSGSSRASMSPAKRPSGRCWKTWVNKQKQCRPPRGGLHCFYP